MVSEEQIVGAGAIIPGGIGQYILRCCQQFSQMGHYVTLVCRAGMNFQDSIHGVSVVGIAEGGLPWGISLFRWFVKNEFDIIEVPDWGGIGSISAVLLSKRRGRLITRGHGHSLWVDRVHGRKERRGKQFLREWLQVHFSQGILANSEFLRRELCRDFRIDSKRVDVCHIGVDPVAIGSSEDLSQKHQGPTMVYVGGLDRRKGPVLLIHVLHEINKLLPQRTVHEPAKLLLVGPDTLTGPNGHSYMEYCRKTAEVLGVGDQIEFHPVTPRHELYELYRLASVFVSGSSGETFGIPFLEAMSLGLPVVTWNRGAASELIVDGENGYLYEFGDVKSFANGVVRILYDQTLWRTMSQNATKSIHDNFLEYKMLARQLEWYSKISFRGKGDFPGETESNVYT